MFEPDARLKNLNYKPGTFSGIASSINGQKLLAWLGREDVVMRLEVASYLDRVAIEALSPHILHEMGPWVTETNAKQLTGHIVRAILEHLGYVQVKSGVTLYRGLFSQGSRYQLPEQMRTYSKNPCAQERKAWVKATLELT